MRKKNCLIHLFLLFILSISCSHAQVGQKENINQYNNGHKDGLWVDSSKYKIREIYYKNGIESGVFKEYNTKGKLLTLGEYQDGKMFGTWYYFENSGHLTMIFKNFSKNTESIINEGDKKRYIPDYKCYSISYYPNGRIKNEGFLLWSEGEAPESDFSREYGEWKYYDETGKVIRTENFK